MLHIATPNRYSLSLTWAGAYVETHTAALLDRMPVVGTRRRIRRRILG